MVFDALRGALLRSGVALAVLAALAIAAGCKSSGGSGGSGASPKELLDYKVAMVEEHADELTPAQQAAIMYYPGRSLEEIDEFVEAAVEEFRETEEERARAESAGIEIGARRRESQRVWVRNGDGRFVLEHTPFDPLRPEANLAADEQEP